MPITRPLVYRVTCTPDREVTGSDSAIVNGPERLLTDEIGLVAAFLNRKIKPLSHHLAAQIGERLHSAEWTVTTDPDVVETIGMHGRANCRRCRAGVDRARIHLIEHPNIPLIVGVLHWAGAVKAVESGQQRG